MYLSGGLGLMPVQPGKSLSITLCFSFLFVHKCMCMSLFHSLSLNVLWFGIMCAYICMSKPVSLSVFIFVHMCLDMFVYL
jgi:hypothetical protein